MALWQIAVIAGLLMISRVDGARSSRIMKPQKILHRKLGDTDLSDIESVVVGGIDESIDKCTDFYQYACGGYLAKNESGLFEAANLNLAKALDHLVGDPDSHVAVFYQSCRDFISSTDNTFDHILDRLEEVDAAIDTKDVMKVAGILSRGAPRHIFASFSVNVNAITSDKTSFFQFVQNALSLSSKEFYFDDRFENQRNVLIADIADSLRSVVRNLSSDEAAKIAISIFSLEKLLAATTTSLTESSAQSYETSYPDRYPTLEEIAKISPTAFGPCIEGFLGESYDPNATVLFDLRETYLAEMETIIKSSDFSTIKWYVKYQFIRGYGAILKQYTKVNNGTSEANDAQLDSSNATCIQVVANTIPDLIGDEYVKYNYPGTTSDAINAMIDALLESMKSRVYEKHYWMDNETASSVYDKLSSLGRIIGSTPSVLDYSSITWQRQDFLANLFEIKNLQNNGLIASVGTLQTGLDLQAAVVNAFYAPEFNTIYFPAGILQPPIYSNDYPSAMTWGTIGAIIAHEITHALDPSGIHLDKNGRYRETWTSSQRGQSIAKSKWDCFVDSYSKLDVDGSDNQTLGKLNGRLTVTENVADSGIAIAYEAYRAQGNKASFRGFTSDQLFFIANAQLWCSSTSNDLALEQMLTDVHSPSKQRVNGEHQNFGEFAKAFNCPIGSFMNPRRKCSWWEIDSNKYC